MKAAVIGAGPHGRRIIEVLCELDGVELTAVVDQRPEALDNLSLPDTTSRCPSVEELWARGDVELVCVATNGPSHAALTTEALAAGARYLLVEKPMACSLAECDQIVQVANSHQARVAVGHTRRYAPVYQWIRQKIGSGAWGRLRAIWVQRPDIGLGCNATHSFDLVSYLAQQPVRRVTGWIDEPIRKNPRGDHFKDPGGLVVMELQAGVRAIVAQIEDGSGPTSMEIDLTGARVRICERTGAIDVIEATYSADRPRPTSFATGEIPAGLTAKPDMAQMIRGCLTELISSAPLSSGPEQGRSAIEVLVAAYLSHERGNCPVELPLTTPEELSKWLPVT